MKKFLSYAVAISIGLLAVAPPINYDIPLLANSFYWLYMVIVAGLLGFFLIYQDIHVSLKVLAVYLFGVSFLSQAPAESFNAYILLVATVYFFLLCKQCDYEIILNMVQAVFWIEILIAMIQHLGFDRLMMFNNPDKTIYFGTVFQQMRLASLFAVMSPFLLLKSRWYIIPIAITCILFKTLGYTFAVAGGVLIYSWFEFKEYRRWIFLVTFLFCAVCAVRSWTHIYVEIVEGRIPIWGVVIKTWCFDTSKNFHGYGSPLNPAVQTGPFDFQRFVFGHGMDTFMPLFPVYKYDPNPFPNPHNDFLKIAWEIGLIGLSGFLFYCGWLFRRVFKRKEFILLAGLVIIAVNMFFAFPGCMTQTVLLMVAFAALCDRPHHAIN